MFFCCMKFFSQNQSQNSLKKAVLKSLVSMHLRQWKFLRVVIEASLKCMVNFRYIFEKKRSVFISTVQEVQLFFSILAIFGYLRQNIFLNPFKAGAQQLGWESCQISWPYLHVEQSYGGKHGSKRPKTSSFGMLFIVSLDLQKKCIKKTHQKHSFWAFLGHV